MPLLRVFPRRWSQRILLLVAVVLVLNESVTRGHVSDGDDGHPLVGADIVLADSGRIVRSVRTNAAGYFRVWHVPFASAAWNLLICAPGYAPMVKKPVSSALLHSGYGLGRIHGRYTSLPADGGWHAPVPVSCPSERAPTASSVVR